MFRTDSLACFTTFCMRKQFIFIVKSNALLCSKEADYGFHYSYWHVVFFKALTTTIPQRELIKSLLGTIICATLRLNILFSIIGSQNIVYGVSEAEIRMI